MTEASELFLFSASRSQLVQEVVKPALEGGMDVLCDRYYDSTTAYQGFGRGIPLDMIHAINRYAIGGVIPDLTFFLDIPIREVEKRITSSKSNKDRMESSGIEFYERVRDGYLQIAKEEPRYRVLQGMQPIDEIHELVWQQVAMIVGNKE
jgi:dTMP kinase